MCLDTENTGDDESKVFADASSVLLERAYSDDEPDYSDSGVPC